VERRGEVLWMEWGGHHCPLHHRVIYYTEEFVDVDHETVFGGLVSAVQRSGLVDGLGEAYRVVDIINIYKGYFGYVDGDDEPQVCDHEGWTPKGDLVDTILVGTWVGLDV